MKEQILATRKPILRINKSLFLDIIHALFLFLFLYTATTKSFDIEGTLGVVKHVPYFRNVAGLLSWGVIAIEYVASILLLFKQTKKLGLWISLILMVAFTIYISLIMIFMPNLPCTCGGVIQELSWAEHLAFNVAFITLAIIGLRLHRSMSKILPENRRL